MPISPTPAKRPLRRRRRFGIPVVFTAHSLGHDKRAAFGRRCFAWPGGEDRAGGRGHRQGRCGRRLVARRGRAPGHALSRREGGARPLHRARRHDARGAEPGGVREGAPRALPAPSRTADDPRDRSAGREEEPRRASRHLRRRAGPARSGEPSSYWRGFADDPGAAPPEQQRVFADIAARHRPARPLRPRRFPQATCARRCAGPSTGWRPGRAGSSSIRPSASPSASPSSKAAMHGLPVVATCHGGPRDTIAEIGPRLRRRPARRGGFRQRHRDLACGAGDLGGGVAQRTRPYARGWMGCLCGALSRRLPDARPCADDASACPSPGRRFSPATSTTR